MHRSWLWLFFAVFVTALSGIAERDLGNNNPGRALLTRRRGGGRGGGGGRSKGGSSSTKGGSTKSGSSTSSTTSTRSFGGGAYYAGGSTSAYRAGSTSPSRIVPIYVPINYPGYWPYWHYNSWYYYYGSGYRCSYHNSTTNQTESKPVVCSCAEYQQCGCDGNTNTTGYLNEIIGNGTYAALNKALADVATINNTVMLIINGTLANGTSSGSSVLSATPINSAVMYIPLAMAVLGAVYGI